MMDKWTYDDCFKELRRLEAHLFDSSAEKRALNAAAAALHFLQRMTTAWPTGPYANPIAQMLARHGVVTNVKEPSGD